MTRKTKYGNTMPFQAAYSREPAGRPRERIHAGLCRLSVGRKHVGELLDARVQGGGEPFCVEPELQMCGTYSTYGQQISSVSVAPMDSAPVAPMWSKGWQSAGDACVQEQTRARGSNCGDSGGGRDWGDCVSWLGCGGDKGWPGAGGSG
jgi:hypothetical protein